MMAIGLAAPTARISSMIRCANRALPNRRVSDPYIVGVGGTTRAGSSSERALALALREARRVGARTTLFDGVFLERLPHFNPGTLEPSPEQAELTEAVRNADGVILATPG